MNSSEVSLRDPDRNAKLPSYAITRRWDYDTETQTFFGHNKDKETIEANYWDNAIKVQEFLERLDRTAVLEKCLNDPELFQKLLKRLHAVQTKGLSGNKSYKGPSFAANPEDIKLNQGWEENLRSPDFRVGALLDPEGTRIFFERLSKFDAQYIHNHQFFYEDAIRANALVNGVNLPFFTDVYIPPSVIDLPLPSEIQVVKTFQERFVSGSKNYEHRSSIVIFIVQDGGTFDSQYQGQQVAQIAYPSAKFIPDYLEKVRTHLSKISETDDQDQQLSKLANGYQAGIRSQAFETVWNSEMMGIVNFYLKKLGLQPIAHADLDFQAFYLSPQAFAQVFKTVVKAFNAPSLPASLYKIVIPELPDLHKDLLIAENKPVEAEWQKFTTAKRLALDACQNGTQSFAVQIAPGLDALRLKGKGDIYTLPSLDTETVSQKILELDQAITVLEAQRNSPIGLALQKATTEIAADLRYIHSQLRDEPDYYFNFKIPVNLYDGISILDRIGQFAESPSKNSWVWPDLNQIVMNQFVDKYPKYKDYLEDFEFQYSLRDAVHLAFETDNTFQKDHGITGNSVSLSDSEVNLLNQVPELLKASNLLTKLSDQLNIPGKYADLTINKLSQLLSNKWGDHVRNAYQELNPRYVFTDDELTSISLYYLYIFPEAISKLQKFRAELTLFLREPTSSTPPPTTTS